MSRNIGFSCIELTPGSNPQVVPEEKEPGPPEGFIDNTVKVYRLNPDGSKGEHLRDMDAFPEGWNDPASYRQRPGQGQRKKEPEKGEDTMRGSRAARPKDQEIINFALKNDFQDLPNRLKKEYQVGYDRAKKWLYEVGIEWPITNRTREIILKKQQAPEPVPTPTPDPAATTQTGKGTKPDHTNGDTTAIPEPVNDSIKPGQPEVKEEDLTPINKAIWNTTINAQYKVHQVCEDVVALALMKELIAGGVV